MWVRSRGSAIHICAGIKNFDPYLYKIDQSNKAKIVQTKVGNGNTITQYVVKAHTLLDYNIESQAEIIADYWALKFKRNPSLMLTKNFEVNIRHRRLDEVIRIYESKVIEAIGR